VFNPSFGKEAVNDFAAGTDQVWIAKSYVPDFEHVLSSARQVGSDVVITVDRNDALTFHHLTMSDLHSGDFVFF
jgi:hypothetical protein